MTGSRTNLSYRMQKWITTLDLGSRTVRWRERGKTFSEPATLLQSAIGTKAQQLHRSSRELLELEWPLLDDDVPTAASVKFLKLLRRKMSNGIFCIAIPDWLPPEEEPPLRKIYREGGFKTVRLVHEMEAIRAANNSEPGVFYLHLGARRTLLAFFEGTDLKFYRSLLWGGDDLNECVRKFLLQTFQLTIGGGAARLLKEGFARFPSRNILGRKAGCWDNIEFDLPGLDGVFDDELVVLLENVRQMLEKLPQVKSLKLSGGLANFAPLPGLLNRTFGLPVTRFPDLENTVLNGLEKLL